MTSLTFYGGVGQVGGNKVLLRDREHSLFLDFGTPYSQRGLFYEEYLQPRPGLGLLDPLEMGLLPPLQGIYRPDLELPGLWEHFRGHPGYRALEPVGGVLVSHAHLDHCGYVSFLKEETPIFSTGMTAFLAKAIQDSGRSGLEQEIAYITPRKEGSFPLETEAWKRAPARQRPFCLGDLQPPTLSPQALDFWSDTPGGRELQSTPLSPASQRSPLPLRCFPLDHSVPGACAWGVETGAGWVLYTGDIRFHGGKGALSRRFVEQAADLRPRALIVEGTYLERQATVAESNVLERALEAAGKAVGLIIADFAPRDVERLMTFLQVAREIGRRLVILSRDAYLLGVVRLLDPQLPDLSQETHLLVYEEPRANPDRWARQVRKQFHHKLVSPEQIRTSQSDYILCFSFLDLNELPSIHPSQGSLYIYSSSEPHNEEQKIDFRRLHNWLEHFGIRSVGLPREEGQGNWSVPPGQEGLHASGHASGPELLQMVKDIHPVMVIPIHTENPQVFQDKLAGTTDIEVRLPELGREIEL